MTSPYRYARVECERRFLLAHAPPSPPGAPVRRIEDRYLHGTRLRVRVVRENDRDPVYKLGHKVRPDRRLVSTVAHTILYLDRAEYDALRALPGDALTKTRTVLPWAGGVTVAVDVFAGALAGLVLAEVDLGEVDLGEDAGLAGTSPVAFVAEVTDDERFTGGVLARTGAPALRRILDEYREDQRHP